MPYMDMARIYKRADGSVNVCLGRYYGYSSFVFSSSLAIIEEGPPSDPTEWTSREPGSRSVAVLAPR